MATTLVLIVYDISAVLLEFKILLDCASFQKPQQSLGKQLITPVQIFWILNRIVVPLLLLAVFFLAAPVSTITNEPFPLPYFFISCVFGLIAIQALLFLEVTKKLHVKIDKHE